MRNHLLARHPWRLGVWFDDAVHEVRVLVNTAKRGEVFQDSFSSIKYELTVVKPTNQQVAVVIKTGLKRVAVIENVTTIAQLGRKILPTEVDFTLAKLNLHFASGKTI